MDWVAVLSLLLVFGGFAARDAWNDKSPRAPELQWWNRNRLIQPWWTTRRTPRERMRTHIRLRGRR